MPEDNKLLVPPFSKKEVKAIAVEGVNEGIADGKVAVGTKLYQHEIIVKAQSEEYKFWIIDYNVAPYTGSGKPYYLITGRDVLGISSEYYSSWGYSPLAIYIDKGWPLDVILSFSGTLREDNFSSTAVISEVTDTVTEL